MRMARAARNDYMQGMRFSDAFLSEIRDRVPISTVIGQRVQWDRRKSNPGRGDFWACCPFHGEKTPSFHCEDKKGRYHCFGCGVSGDHFRFLTEHDSMSFPEAVEKIADMAGVPMPVRDAVEEKRERERASLHDVMEMATAFFEAQLQAAAGARARSYLRGRGLSAVTQQTFRLGYAPDSRNALKEHLAGRGVPKEAIEACGLVRAGPDIPVSYDWFRDRIMFPIEDRRGRVIAFGGRAMSPDVAAKYMNSPETDLFHKGNVLYNLARARKALGKDEPVIAVEGYMDVIALAQAGIANAVAPLGTALTENQMELLWRLSPEPVLCFDGDQAGLRAAWRAADMVLPAVQPGRTARFALLPDGQDPDDLVRNEGVAAFRAVLADARPLSELLWMRETAGGVFETPERRAELERTLRELTARIRDESVRFHYAQDMRERVQAFFGTTQPRRPRRTDDKGRGGRGQGRFGAGADAGRIAVSDSLARSALVKKSGNDMPLREIVLVATLVNHPTLIDELFETIEDLDFTGPDLRRMHRVVIDMHAREVSPSRDAIVAAIAAQQLGEAWQRAELQLRRAYQWPALEGAATEDAREAFLQALALHRKARALHRELKHAEAVLAAEDTDENLRHLVDIQTQLRAAEAPDALIEGFGVLSGRASQS
jgi:DNA primase